ncbi:hypothetical protein AGABI2DRAFT_202089 [Agaricus bisporus var. bisporus H97]|uniref:hypothetical protein n=1 Tax=Agaricus bisporus var. bisporus (strain H97 / ATCC MYA-4626 / FGSC 10389) TaxID=936046 RepID=UPI00029F691A|nr:hypothetical protein AGABI2DRAFT_202089 [Agaricus bisporus var. bisporus H97]EKV47859.1 hypothetical protein AGABI2DRAFT_202089 [Agaricus bisporus var. bisporus H97]
MPRGLRKRGRRHKNTEEDDYSHEQTQDGREDGFKLNLNEADISQPSWILPSTSQSDAILTSNPEAPFGFVDTEVKAYFRTVDVQIQDWQSSQVESEEMGGNTDIDPNEERRLFFVAALTEMQGKERELATDPDCSIVLERMANSMDDFVRRVLMDSMAGSYELLIKHRFASHVCQTLFTLAVDTIQREMKGIYPRVPDSQDKGELRTMKQLILDICEELLPAFPSHIMDPFASHVIRSLLVLLSPNLANESLVRSKKSAAWKAKQGSMKSVFEKDKGREPVKQLQAPSEFHQMTKQFLEVLKSGLDENEIRAMAASKVASPGLKMLLEVEADLGSSGEPDSLMDRVTVGVVSACREGNAPLESSDYLNTLLRDTTSSHLSETIITRAPDDAFRILWNLYLKGKLPRLSVHPVANFVVAKAFGRADEQQLLDACQELADSWQKIIAASRSGVLRAVVDRVANLRVLGDELVKAVFSAFALDTAEEKLSLVPCALYLLPFKDYQTRKSTVMTAESRVHSREGNKKDKKLLEPQIQGSLLLQSLLHLPEPHYEIVIQSINSLSLEERIQLAHNSSSSRIYDVLLDSSTIPSKTKRSFVLGFIGHYHQLADDRFGSRIVDRCWNFADTYLKEKIARSVFPHQQTLAGSFYGKFFSRNLNLYLLQRRPEEWRNFQTEKKRQADVVYQSSLAKKQEAASSLPQVATSEPVASPQPTKKRKRKGDEIDALFNASLGNKVKKAALGNEVKPPYPQASAAKEENSADRDATDKGLLDVLGALKNAPKGEKRKKKRKS